MDRVYVESADLTPGARVRLDPAELHHLRVKRLGAGDRVRLFDGRGGELVAEIVSIERGDAVLKIVEADPEVRGAVPAVSIVIGAAIPKGKRAQVFLEKATELGVATIFP